MTKMKMALIKFFHQNLVNKLTDTQSGYSNAKNENT
jgi:hypothetical protein